MYFEPTSGTSNFDKFMPGNTITHQDNAAELLRNEIIRGIKMLTYREREIIKLRFGLGDGYVYTLEEVAHIFKVTRERIRQVETKAVKKLLRWTDGDVLDIIREAISLVLDEFGGFCQAVQFRHTLCDLLDWSEKTSPEQTIALTILSDCYIKVSSGYVAAPGFPCTQCNRIDVHLQLNESLLRSVLISENEHMQNACHVLSVTCCEGCNNPHPLTDAFLQWKCSTKPALTAILKQYEAKRNSIQRDIHSILSQASKPMDISTITELLNNQKSRCYTQKQVQTAANNLAKQSDDIFFWERGGIYVHRKNMNTTLPLLEIIEDYLIQALQSNTSHGLALFAIFEKYKDACVHNGIPSAFALHACLKARNHKDIAFASSPNVSRPGAEQKRDKTKVLEEWAANKRDYFSQKEMMRYAHQKMGVTKERFSVLSSYLNSVIRYHDKLFVHIDLLEWTSEKQSCLEDIANTYWKECLIRGTLFARTDQLLEAKAEIFPALPDSFEWYATLIGSLLDRSDNVSFFGNTRLCYGFNSEPSSPSWADIVEHVLRTQFKGGTSMREFSEYLRDELRLIRRQLTPKMLAQCSSIHFTKYEIHLTKGDENAS